MENDDLPITLSSLSFSPRPPLLISNVTKRAFKLRRRAMEIAGSAQSRVEAPDLLTLTNTRSIPSALMSISKPSANQIVSDLAQLEKNPWELDRSIRPRTATPRLSAGVRAATLEHHIVESYLQRQMEQMEARSDSGPSCLPMHSPIISQFMQKRRSGLGFAPQYERRIPLSDTRPTTAESNVRTKTLSASARRVSSAHLVNQRRHFDSYRPATAQK